MRPSAHSDCLIHVEPVPTHLHAHFHPLAPHLQLQGGPSWRWADDCACSCALHWYPRLLHLFHMPCAELYRMGLLPCATPPVMHATQASQMLNPPE